MYHAGWNIKAAAATEMGVWVFFMYDNIRVKEIIINIRTNKKDIHIFVT